MKSLTWKAKEPYIVLTLFIIGFFIRLYRIDAPGLCDFEIITALRVHQPFWNTIFLAGESTFPPLYYIFQNLWVHVFGASEWALRFPSAVFSSLTIIAVYKLGSELIGKKAGLIACALMVFSPFAVNYAQMAKMYSLFWLFSTVTFVYFFRLFKNESRGNWFSYAFVSLLSCYTMYTGFLLLVAQNLMFFMMGARRQWKRWLLCQAVIILCCIPWIVFFLSSKHVDYDFNLPYSGLNYFTFLGEAFVWLIGNYNDRVWSLNFLLDVFLLGCFLAGALNLYLKEKKLALRSNHYGLLMWVVIPIVLYFIADRAYLHTFKDTRLRYIGFIQVPLFLMIGSQMINFRGWAGRILISAVFILALNNTYVYFKENLRLPQQDWRVLTRELSAKVGKDDVVLFSDDYTMRVFEYYDKKDTGRFFEVSLAHCSSSLLSKLGILKPATNSIFIVYGKPQAPQMELKGYSLTYRDFLGGTNFLQYQRN
ncbi:MAG: glycosyltransferase family 39 protein [Candidatus Omnitrophica bacterium]|nr:glycosyltransferase family 39 protein [Candidatus Omnitrophota bacterium]